MIILRKLRPFNIAFLFETILKIYDSPYYHERKQVSKFIPCLTP